jgi:hypothetical protein
MGWTTEHASRDEVVKRESGPWQAVEGATVTAVKHSRSGNEDWFLYQVEKDGKVDHKFISVMVWEDGAHKEIDEACGPYYYGCPVEWLDEVPAPKGDSAATWRAEVRRRATPKTALCGYVARYQGKRVEVYAPTAFAAQKKVAEQLKVPAKKQYLITVTLCERPDGSEVIHTADF